MHISKFITENFKGKVHKATTNKEKEVKSTIFEVINVNFLI